ncbi:hypothetical protein ASE66_20920 [Bosea sp. Root483D1]|nr:hypothetical protein ASE66_20920 [Bosea sp. Root483D1]
MADRPDQEVSADEDEVVTFGQEAFQITLDVRRTRSGFSRTTPYPHRLEMLPGMVDRLAGAQPFARCLFEHDAFRQLGQGRREAEADTDFVLIARPTQADAARERLASFWWFEIADGIGAAADIELAARLLASQRRREEAAMGG